MDFTSPAVQLAVLFSIGVIAGAMVLLSMDELLPAARNCARGHETVYGTVVGMAAMAVYLVLFT